jgi:hypothetical protein
VTEQVAHDRYRLTSFRRRELLADHAVERSHLSRAIQTTEQMANERFSNITTTT